MRAPALLVIALVFSISETQVAQSQPGAPENAVLHVVVINKTEQKFLRRGTAFHVGSGLFYTNAHVVKKGVPEGYTDWYLAGTTATLSISSWLGPAEISCIDSRWRDTGDTGRSRPYDVALIRINRVPDNLPSVPLSVRPPVVGQRVTVKGYPSASRGWPPKLYAATGRVREVQWSDGVFWTEIESGFTLGGSSGSPVMAEDGSVVGIIYAGVGIENRTASSLLTAVLVSAAQQGCPVR